MVDKILVTNDKSINYLIDKPKIKLNYNFNTNSVSRKITKTWNITKRALKNNLGKIIIFSILFTIVIILITAFEIPIDGSYIDNSNSGQRFLSFLNIIILSIVVAGLVSIFNIENTISKDYNNNRDELLCKYRGIIHMLQYNYLHENIIENSEIKDIILETDIDLFKLINLELKIKNKILENEELTDDDIENIKYIDIPKNSNNIIDKELLKYQQNEDNIYINDKKDKIKQIKNIILEKIVLKYIYDNIQKDRRGIQLYNKIDNLFIKLDIDDFSNIHSIKDDIISNINQLLEILNNQKNKLNKNSTEILDNHYMKYYYYLNTKSANKINIEIKNFESFINNNKLPLNINLFRILLNNIDVTFINNLYLKLNDTCRNELTCK